MRRAAGRRAGGGPSTDRGPLCGWARMQGSALCRPWRMHGGPGAGEGGGRSARRLRMPAAPAAGTCTGCPAARLCTRPRAARGTQSARPRCCRPPGSAPAPAGCLRAGWGGCGATAAGRHPAVEQLLPRGWRTHVRYGGCANVSVQPGLCSGRAAARPTGRQTGGRGRVPRQRSPMQDAPRRRACAPLAMSARTIDNVRVFMLVILSALPGSRVSAEIDDPRGRQLAAIEGLE